MVRRLRWSVLVLVAAIASTALAHPGSAIVVDRRGYVYFLDTGDGLWIVEPGGKVVRRGGNRFHWMALDENPQRFGSLPSIPDGEIEPVGSNPTVLVSSDVPLVIGRDGALYYPEMGSGGRLNLMRFTRSGARTVFATLPAGPRWLNGLTTGPDGSLYYAEDRAVRRVDARGVVTTVAEKISPPNCVAIPGVETEDGPYLRGLGVAADGSVYVAASGCGSVLKITPRGVITSVMQTASPWSPTAIAIAPSGVYVQEYIHTAVEDRRAWVPRVRKILPNGSIVHITTVVRAKR